MVGDIGFEPMASSMSPRHSTPELIAQALNYKNMNITILLEKILLLSIRLKIPVNKYLLISHL